MSLLIDALKKAEKAKQEAAQDGEAIDFSNAIEAGADNEAPFETESTLTLEQTAAVEPPTLVSEPVPQPAEQDSALTLSDEVASDSPAATQDLNLALQQPTADALAHAAMPESTSPADVAAVEESHSEWSLAPAPQSATTPQAVAPAQAAEPQPSTAQDAAPASSAAPHTAPTHTLTLEQNAQPQAQADSSRQAGVTLRQAKPYQPGVRQRKTWLIAAVVSGVALLGGGVAYYFLDALDNLSGSRTFVPGDAPVTRINAPVNTAAEVMPQADGQTPVAEQQPAPGSGTVQAATSPLPASTATQAADNNTANRPMTKTVSRQPAKPVPARAAPKTRPAPVRAGQKPPLTIVHRQVPDPVSVMLGNAYNEYQHGNYSGASQYYRQVLATQTDNRDALLGLAIIAHRSHQPELARQYYKKILSLNPKDSQAIAGMFALQNASEAVQDESRLKLLIDQEPEAAHLHYALGNLFVRQGRWLDAQKAFFDAYHYDPANADYAYNLAVSLDQLDQPQAALQYYRLALQLAQGRTVSFNAGDVRQRMASLAASSPSPSQTARRSAEPAS